MMWSVGPDCLADEWEGYFYLVHFVERDNATCDIAAFEEMIEANAQERVGRALVDKRAA